jgi:hypothetical protein
MSEYSPLSSNFFHRSSCGPVRGLMGVLVAESAMMRLSEVGCRMVKSMLGFVTGERSSREFSGYDAVAIASRPSVIKGVRCEEEEERGGGEKRREM